MICKIAWNDTPVQQHVYWCFFGMILLWRYFRPPVSPWGILRTGYKTRSPLKPLGNLDQFDSHFTDFQHLSKSATFDLWTTNLRGSFLLVWTFWLHLIWWSKTPGLIVRRKLPGKVLCLWFSILGCLVVIAMSDSDSLFLLPFLWRFVKQIHRYLQIIRLISFVPARCRRSLASHREWLSMTVSPNWQCSERSVSHQVLQCFPHPRRFQSSLENSAMFLSAQCSQKNACTGNPWNYTGPPLTSCLSTTAALDGSVNPGQDGKKCRSCQAFAMTIEATWVESCVLPLWCVATSLSITK